MRLQESHNLIPPGIPGGKHKAVFLSGKQGFRVFLLLPNSNYRGSRIKAFR